MQVMIFSPDEIFVEDVGNFGELRVDTNLDAAELFTAVASSGLGVVDGDHVFLDPAWLRRLAMPEPCVDWDTQFAAMVRFAVAKGWCDSQGRVRAHVHRSASLRTEQQHLGMTGPTLSIQVIGVWP